MGLGVAGGRGVRFVVVEFQVQCLIMPWDVSLTASWLRFQVFVISRKGL